MSKNSIKTMLLGISLILIGEDFHIEGAGYAYIANIALGLFGFMVVLSGFFSKE